jgi:hypothetical protein
MKTYEQKKEEQWSICKKTAEYILKSPIGQNKILEKLAKTYNIIDMMKFFTSNKLTSSEAEEFIHYIHQFNNETEIDTQKQLENLEEIRTTFALLRFFCALHLKKDTQKTTEN